MDPDVITRHNRPRAVLLAASETARRVFSGIEPGCEVLCLTHGQFSLVDAIAALLDHTGPAAVTISTWSAARVDLSHAHKFLADGRIRSLRFVVDRSFATRQPDYCAALVEMFGHDAIRTTVSHAKFALITNDRWHLAIRTSMNLNENRRLETIEVSDDPALAAFLGSVVDQIFASVPAGEMNNYAMPDAPDVSFVPATLPARDEVSAVFARRHVTGQTGAPTTPRARRIP
jgi:hypothetical protein